MSIRSPKSSQDRVEQPLTPLIDVVFQLLVFFVMSLRVTTSEGDLEVKMPRSRREGADLLQPSSMLLRLRLSADAGGELASMSLGGRQFAGSDWPGLKRYLANLVQTPSRAGGLQDKLQVQIECDYQLSYHHTIAAITTVGGVQTEAGPMTPMLVTPRIE